MRFRRHTAPILSLLLCFAASGCGRSRLEETANEREKVADERDAEAGQAQTAEDREKARQAMEARHRVVFADRSSMGYLLLVPGVGEPEPPSRDDLAALVKKEFAADLDAEEVKLLEYFVGLEASEGALPVALDPDDPSSAMRTAAARYDLIGLHIDVVAVDEVIPEDALKDPVATRGIAPALRPTLPRRKWAVLLRGDYRSRNAFRGLRLLQTLVRVVAAHDEALIHDPDTLETMDVDTFTRRRLQGSLGNVADQIIVVPFPDPRHDGRVRLTTRGMRRFGAVDLELDGLPRDPKVLQRGTDLLLGLALVLIKDAEVTETGVATEVPEAVSVTWRDVEAAYRSRGEAPPRCEDCPEEALVHLVEREAEPQDPEDHVVTRVIAPRSKSDLPGYDHLSWVTEAIADLFGE